jgi:hypothetical protein
MGCNSALRKGGRAELRFVTRVTNFWLRFLENMVRADENAGAALVPKMVSVFRAGTETR